MASGMTAKQFDRIRMWEPVKKLLTRSPRCAWRPTTAPTFRGSTPVAVMMPVTLPMVPGVFALIPQRRLLIHPTRV